MARKNMGRGTKRPAIGGGKGHSGPKAKLTRTEKEYLTDFGEEHPLKDFQDDEEVTDGEVEGEEEEGEGEGNEGEDYESEEEEESAYNKLLGSLNLKGKAAELLKRRRREEDGEEGEEEEEEEEEDGDEEEEEEGEEEEIEEGEGMEGDDMDNIEELGVEEEIVVETAKAKAKKGKKDATNLVKMTKTNKAANELQEDESDDEAPNGGEDIFKVHFCETMGEQIEIDRKDQWTVGESTPLGHHVACSHVSAANQPFTSLEDLKFTSRLHHSWSELRKRREEDDSSEKEETFTAIQSEIMTHMARYRDILYPMRSHKNAQEIIDAYCLHALNHVYKTRNRVLKNTEKIKTAHAEGKDVIGDVQDQGFTRPRVLILLPFRNTAERVISTLLAIAAPANLPSGRTLVHHKQRFEDQYGVLSAEEDPDHAHRPEDFQEMFQGNIDDCFTMGISFTRKEVKLYASMYKSDVIVASPLGLRMLMGTKGDKKYDYDFLSSIEMVILDQVDVFLMQNWEHMSHIYEHLNLQPMQSHDTDISRLRPWYSDLLGKYYRQNLMFGDIPTPEVNSLFTRDCHNYAGKVKFSTTYEGSICNVVQQIQQVFLRLDVDTYSELEDRRFNHFIREILPGLRDSLHKHTAIFVSSYFNYVRLRNFFKKEELSATYICEYTKDKDISRSRSLMYHGRRDFLLFTERFHFFRRYRLRGIHHIYFYELPVYPQFYPELLDFMESRPDITCTALYSKYDALRLERITLYLVHSQLIPFHPHPSWHVYSRENIEKVKKDEEEARLKEEANNERAALAEQEARMRTLRTQAHTKYGTRKEEGPSVADPLAEGHVNLFYDLEHARDVVARQDREKEKKEEQNDWEKKVGIVTYLGQSANETTKKKAFYESMPVTAIQSEPKEDNVQEKRERGRKKRQDPLANMQKYLSLKSESQPPSSKALTVHKYRHERKQESKHKHKNNKRESKEDKMTRLRSERLARERQEQLRARQTVAGDTRLATTAMEPAQ
eukprot:Ihof_evm22s27 gene=Ihof_evmTU22s27